MLYALQTKIVIYKGVGNGQLFKTISMAPWQESKSLVWGRALFSYSMCSNFKDLRKVAVMDKLDLTPSNSKKQILKFAIKVYDLTCPRNSVVLSKLPWQVGDFELDKSGMRLVISSADGMYLCMYSTLLLSDHSTSGLHEIT